MTRIRFRSGRVMLGVMALGVGACGDAATDAGAYGQGAGAPAGAMTSGGGSATQQQTAAVGTTGGSSGTGGANSAASTVTGSPPGATTSAVDQSASTTGSMPAGPVDCSAIAEHDGWQLCDSGFDFCAAVFNDGAGCAALCAAAGLSCAESFENAEDGCGPDTSRPALSCSANTGHQSDYCMCRGGGGVNAATTSTGGSTTGSGLGGTGGSGDSGSSGDDATNTTSSTTGQGTTGGSVDSEACEQVSGESITVDSTIVVESGDTFDGECRRYRAGSSLGDGSQDEGQDPVFTLEDGARLINVVLGAPAADGIHTEGDATLESVVWEDVGEDALTIEGSGTVVIDGGRAFNSEDKIFQINAQSTFRVSNFTASNAGKFIRQNGGTTFRVDVFIDACDISDMDESIFRTDSSSSTVTMTNTRYSNIGDALFLGVSSGNVTTSNNTEY